MTTAPASTLNTLEKGQKPLGKKNGGRRIQFEFSADAYERLNTLKEMTASASYAELIRNALRVYEWVMEQEKEGNQIGIIKDNKMVKEVKFIF